MDSASPLYSAAHRLRAGGRDDVRAALVDVRQRTLELADAYAVALRHEAFRVPMRATLNPPLWEWGHVAWFQEWWVRRNRQRERGVDCDPDHERLPSLLAGADALYDSSRVAHASRWDLPLPDELRTRDYLASTLATTLAELDVAGADDASLYFFRLVALHEAMHAEAAEYMARGLGIAVPTLPRASVEAIAGGTLKVPGQRFVAGWQGSGFAFDNELAPIAVTLDAFEIDAEPVSWGRFDEFVRAGGYSERKWWDEAGWAWLQVAGIPERGDHDPREAAVHVTAFEADAWCRWAGRRLPTEFEWECAATTQPAMRWGTVWEWTSSPFEPYPDFRAHPYRDYSQPWFGTRRVLRGASAATSPWLAHPRYRNFFEPQRADILSGFRSCR